MLVDLLRKVTNLTMLQLIDALLHRYQSLGIDLGLERMQTLLAALGNPHQQVPVVHVAGSNGKGSVCAFVSAVLTAAGYRVGRYTSPYLVDWTDQICLNDRPITPEQLLHALQQVDAAIAPDLPITQFELLTATAWWIFAQASVDIAVIEVGLGGRLDATNVCDCPLVTAITSISLEHCQYLGSTLADIAREKAGILKSGCVAVVAPLPAEAQTIVTQRIQALNCPVIWPQPARWREDSAPLTVSAAVNTVPWVELGTFTYPLPLQGTIQLTNSAVAIAIVHQLRRQGWQITDEAITTGMARTQWLGRLQWVQWQQTPLLLDGAHNPAAAQILRQYVDRFRPKSVHWLMGMLGTKEHRAVLEALLRQGDRLTLVPIPTPNSADPIDLVNLASRICSGLAACENVEDLETGLSTLICSQGITSSGPHINVLCGSLYLVGHYLRHHTRPRTTVHAASSVDQL